MATQKKLVLPRKAVTVPARSQIAVNKSVLELGKKSKINKQPTVDDNEENKKLDEVFLEILDIALALLPTVPFVYISPVRKWIQKILGLKESDKRNRNFYISNLILQMQNMRIDEPFNKDPPPTLENPRKLFNAVKMKKMIQDMENTDLMNYLREGLTPHGLSSFRTDFKTPVEFFDDQLIPPNGIVAYGGCFSNHFY